MQKILVTQSFLPPVSEYMEYLDAVWQSAWLTNAGPLATKLESELEHTLKVPHLLFTGNGTIAMQLAIKALNLQGEIITTPYSYVATVSSIIWEHCTPVFADIDEDTLCLDPHKVEQLITPQTVAIMPVHVYGIPCDLEAFERISQAYQLPIIYDAAHAFGVEHDGQSILTHGAISTLSFHATKLFHTVEGGAMITNSDELKDTLKLLRSFGHVGDEHYQLGVNGKNSEFHAAMGLANLKHIRQIIDRRRELSQQYDAELQPSLAVGQLRRPTVPAGTTYNYAYHPVIFATHELMMKTKQLLEENNIFPRRYFFPSLNQLPYVTGQPCPISESISTRVLCLPLYYDLRPDQVSLISALINQALAADWSNI